MVAESAGWEKSDDSLLCSVRRAFNMTLLISAIAGWAGKSDAFHQYISDYSRCQIACRCAGKIFYSYPCIVSRAGNLTQLVAAVSNGQEILTFLIGDNSHSCIVRSEDLHLRTVKRAETPQGNALNSWFNCRLYSILCQ